jgi:hypothetical protein
MELSRIKEGTVLYALDQDKIAITKYIVSGCYYIEEGEEGYYDIYLRVYGKHLYGTEDRNIWTTEGTTTSEENGFFDTMEDAVAYWDVFLDNQIYLIETGQTPDTVLTQKIYGLVINTLQDQHNHG